MRKLYRPKNDMELAFIKSIFDGEDIPYFVHNENFGSLQIGPQIDLFNARMIMVDEAYYERAKDLIADFLDNMEADVEPEQTDYSFWAKVRMIAEAVVFGWFIPGKKKQQKRTESE